MWAVRKGKEDEEKRFDRSGRDLRGMRRGASAGGIGCDDRVRPVLLRTDLPGGLRRAVRGDEPLHPRHRHRVSPAHDVEVLGSDRRRARSGKR